jgi:hypothetical protein
MKEEPGAFAIGEMPQDRFIPGQTFAPNYLDRDSCRSAETCHSKGLRRRDSQPFLGT